MMQSTDMGKLDIAPLKGKLIVLGFVQETQFLIIMADMLYSMRIEHHKEP